MSGLSIIFDDKKIKKNIFYRSRKRYLIKVFNDSVTMSLRVDDSKLFKKYCKIWKTSKLLLGIEFDSEPVYGDTDCYIKTKVKMYDNKVNTNFQGK